MLLCAYTFVYSFVMLGEVYWVQYYVFYGSFDVKHVVLQYFIITLLYVSSYRNTFITLSLHVVAFPKIIPSPSKAIHFLYEII